MWIQILCTKLLYQKWKQCFEKSHPKPTIFPQQGLVIVIKKKDHLGWLSINLTFCMTSTKVFYHVLVWRHSKHRKCSFGYFPRISEGIKFHWESIEWHSIMSNWVLVWIYSSLVKRISFIGWVTWSDTDIEMLVRICRLPMFNMFDMGRFHLISQKDPCQLYTRQKNSDDTTRPAVRS